MEAIRRNAQLCNIASVCTLRAETERIESLMPEALGSCALQRRICRGTWVVIPTIVYPDQTIVSVHCFRTADAEPNQQNRFR
jgi:hypothetical protein